MAGRPIWCQNCRNVMTWAAQRVQFGRLTRAGVSRERVNEVLPRCQKCVTIWLKETGEPRPEPLESGAGNLAELEPVPLGELLATKRHPQCRHGKAEFVPANNTIRLYPGGTFYEVDLDDFNDPREALDWILHVHGKAWCDAQMLKDFLDCLNDACLITFSEDATGVLVHGQRGKTRLSS